MYIILKIIIENAISSKNNFGEFLKKAIETAAIEKFLSSVYNSS